MSFPSSGSVPDAAAFSSVEEEGMDTLFVGLDVHKLSINGTTWSSVARLAAVATGSTAS
jgi:hypothetical protein